MKQRTIILAHLVHTGRGLHTSMFPLGIGFISSYAKHCLRDGWNILLATSLDELHGMVQAAAERNEPTILGLSIYCWNLELSYHASEWARQAHPRLTVVFGGVNFPYEKPDKIEFLRHYPLVDFFVENEGEVGFVRLAERLHQYGFDAGRLKKGRESIPNCTYLAGNALMEGPTEVVEDLNLIPSPYLTGEMDQFFTMPLLPVIETTRGCPFSCTFCTQGPPSKSMIRRFSHERTRDELEYICNHAGTNADMLFIADSNFGMYKEDLATAGFIADAHEKHRFPTVLGAQAGKNNQKQIIEVSAALKGIWMIGASIQSSDKQVLKNIKRDNIDLRSFEAFLEYENSLSKETLTSTDIILGLPGDTLEKHLASIQYALDSGVKKLFLYQTQLLVGSEMASMGSRDRFGLLTKFRVIPGAFGNYTLGGETRPVAEIEEIIVGSSSMSFEDYLSCRIFDLLVQTYTCSVFEEVFALLKSAGVSTFELIEHINSNMDRLFSDGVKKVIDNFIFATRDDLFDSRDEALRFTSSTLNIDKYISGEIGFNEMLVCRAQLLMMYDDISSALLASVKELLRQKDEYQPWHEDMLDQYFEFVGRLKRDFHLYEKDFSEDFAYDFCTIVSNPDISLIDTNTTGTSYQFRFFHNEEQKKYIENGLFIYNNTPSGLGQLFNKLNLKKVFRKAELVSTLQ